MSPKACSIDGCDKPGDGGRGWCGTHWARWRRHGTTDVTRGYGRTLQQRLWDRLIPDGDCWIWPGGHSGYGHGRVWHDGHLQYAHRLAYTAMVAEIPDGLTLDHLCRKPRCCNPQHLEPVPRALNASRQAQARRLVSA